MPSLARLRRGPLAGRVIGPVAGVWLGLLAGCSQAPLQSPPAPAASRHEVATPGQPGARPGTASPARPLAASPAAGASAPLATPGPLGKGSMLAAEQRWLGSLFRGTPVRVLSDEGGALRVDVPLAHSFEVGGDQPKPPLQAVMQRLALSMQRQPTTRLAVAAPAGPRAEARQAAMREQLVMMGLPMHRVSAAGVAGDDMVSLRLAPAPQAIARLSDRQLPPAVLGPPSSAPQAVAGAVPPSAAAPAVAGAIKPPSGAR